MEIKKEIELMEIALRYIDKSYDYEQLMDGDDLYNATEEEKEVCGNYWSECKEVGTKQFEQMIKRKKVAQKNI